MVQVTTEEKLDRLTGIVESLAASVVHHDDQIDKLLAFGEQLKVALQEQKERMDQLSREWQAYLHTIRPQ
jgi:hypothetical protein